LKRWRATAKRADETLSEWARARLNLLATPDPQQVLPVVSGDQTELPCSVNFNIRVRPRELKRWRAAAKRADETLSEWARARLNLLATPDPQQVLPVVSGDQTELPFMKKRSA
jgi:hypothetical protein